MTIDRNPWRMSPWSPMKPYKLAAAELITEAIAKNYDGYRMMWYPEHGFAIVEHSVASESPICGKKPEQPAIDRFKSDLEHEALENKALADYLGKYPEMKMDRRRTTLIEIDNLRADKERLPMPKTFSKAKIPEMPKKKNPTR